MTSYARTSITAFSRGQEFHPSSFTLSEADVAAYLHAVGDTSEYGEGIPPLALVALGLRALQEEISLPEGSLHTGQEVEHEAIARVGEALTLTARVAQRSERQGYVISVIEFEVSTQRGVAVRARTTIMAPGTPA